MCEQWTLSLTAPHAQTCDVIEPEPETVQVGYCQCGAGTHRESVPCRLLPATMVPRPLHQLVRQELAWLRRICTETYSVLRELTEGPSAHCLVQFVRVIQDHLGAPSGVGSMASTVMVRLFGNPTFVASANHADMIRVSCSVSRGC